MALSRREFAERAKGQKTLWSVCAYDALTAKLIEDAGFDVIVTTGYGISASLLGQPDLELYTMTENCMVTRNIVSAVSIPVVADMDTGYGNVVNVTRSMREFEGAGVSGVTIEDQRAPKQCPMYGNALPLIPVDEAVAKIRAAVAARSDPNVLVIARTDASEPAEAIARAKTYVAAGADLVMPIGRTFDGIDGLCDLRAACGVPLYVVVNKDGPYDVPAAQLEEVAGLVAYPLVLLMTAAFAIKENLRSIKQNRSLHNLPAQMMDLGEFKSFIGHGEIEELHKSFFK